jgi:Cu+-exporting ATPase
VLEIAIEQIEPGDTVVVQAGERVPVDGTVIVGRSDIDESLLTGESLPVAKAVDQRGVRRHPESGRPAQGSRAEGVGSQTQLMEIVRLTEAAQGSKAPIQKLADRISGVFVPDGDRHRRIHLPGLVAVCGDPLSG